MKNMFKHFGIIILATIIGLSMTACGSLGGGMIRVENTTSDTIHISFFPGITSLDEMFNHGYIHEYAYTLCIPGETTIYYTVYPYFV